MAMIFPIDRQLKAIDYVNFYFRRIKRIAPVYLVVLLLTMVFLAPVMLYREYWKIVNDLKWARLFATNILDLYVKFDYFEVVSF